MVALKNVNKTLWHKKLSSARRAGSNFPLSMTIYDIENATNASIKIREAQTSRDMQRRKFGCLSHECIRRHSRCILDRLRL